MAINLNTAMDTLGVALSGITGLRVYDYLADNVSVPAAVVGLPQPLTYDHTHARGIGGCDRATFPVYVVVGKVSDRAARDQLAVYCDGTAAATVSVKAALDAVPGARVMDVDFTNPVMTIAGADYLAATFHVDLVA